MHRVEEEGAIINLERQFGGRFRFLRDAATAAHAAVIRQTTKADPDFGPFWEATRALGYEAMTAALELVRGISLEDCLVVTMPRGGFPYLQGVREAAFGLSAVVTNDGGIRDPNKPLIPKEIREREIAHLFVADPVVDTGGSFARTIGALAERGFRVEQMTALAVVIHPGTVASMLRQYPDLRVIAADAESRIIPQPDGRRFLADLDDMGALVEEAVKQDASLAMHWLMPGLYQ